MSLTVRYVMLAAAVLVLLLVNLFCGSVSLPASQVFAALTGRVAEWDTAGFIVLSVRVPMAVTAALGGASLSASGLLLQTAFRNPLAGPSVLGISSGASLGVALVMLASGGMVTSGVSAIGSYAAVVAGAFAGSMLIMGLLLALSTLLRSPLMLLITGIMVGYLASSVIMLLNFSASADGIASYVMWGMSTWGGVNTSQLPLYSIFCAIGLVMALMLVKPLDLLMLGDEYALNLGIDTRRVRNLLLLATGLMTAVVTAYCGPVSFLGLSVPHITRLFFPTDSHRTLLPAVMLTGSAVALGCNAVCTLASTSVLPLNAVTPLIGAPVVLWVILRRRNN